MNENTERSCHKLNYSYCTVFGKFDKQNKHINLRQLHTNTVYNTDCFRHYSDTEFISQDTDCPCPPILQSYLLGIVHILRLTNYKQAFIRLHISAYFSIKNLTLNESGSISHAT